MSGGGTWFSMTLMRYRWNQLVILANWFLRSGSDVLQIKPELSKWKLRWLCHGCNQVIILITWFWYGYNQVPEVGTWFGRSCKSSYGKRNLISDDSPNPHFGDLGVSNLSITVFWHFPEWEVPLYWTKASVDKELDKLHQAPQREAWAVTLRLR